ncbi:MAG: hypothetical protein HC772_10820 [Leptolyngbyaceae cyanobacterium CRU_2_3]|nr:hypothetical protein [Leptolyngbyaceae cyanobacterium CRU_2_3]
MEPNPYLQLQSDQNPYLTAALSREADSHLIQNLLGLVPELLPEPSLGAAQGVYQSALEVSPDSPDAGYTSATGTPQFNPYQSTPAQPIARGQHNVSPDSSSDDSRGNQLTPKKPPVEKPPVETLYRSPEAVLRETARQQQQEQERSQQAAIQQQRLEQEQKQQATAAQHQLELRARAFLRKVNALDPLDSERMWFESFAEHCPSRLAAAIELIKTA